MRSAVAAGFSVGGPTCPAHAHGFGQRYDLPIPLSLWVAGAAAAVALSFVIIGLFARGGARRSGYPRVNLLQWRFGRVLAHERTRSIARVMSVALFLLVVAAGTFGNQNPTRNLAPAFVWIVWWVGFAYVSAMLGDLWAVVNPWSATFSWADRLSRRLGAGPLSLGIPYPAWLGVWPAIVLFGAFAWAELVYTGRSLPAKLALMILVYSLIAWTGMLTFGRHAWLRHGDPFAVTFGLLARFAPTEVRVASSAGCRDCEERCDTAVADCVGCGECFARAAPASRELNLRPYGVGLLKTGDVSRSLVVFVLLLLSTVTYDGFTATPAWSTIESSLYPKLTWLGDLRSTTVGTLGLLAFPLAFVVVYGVFAYAMASAAGWRLSPTTVACLFVLSLIPIAIAYHLAHYFTYLLIQGQLAIRLVSDPFGVGWNLFGTARYRPDVGIVGARFAWYTAVIAVVAGHIIAVWLAHVVALREFPERREAIRSQVPMLVLMVGYTIASLWILAQPIVETSPGG